MDLYICEKPSQGKDLANILNIANRDDGYIHNSDSSIIITWAIGHLLELYNPDDYADEYKSWSFKTLPIIPDHWQFKIKGSVKKQYRIIEKLIKKANTIFISTDYDREGEAIARNLIHQIGYSGNIKRVCLTALDPQSIKKALSNIKNGSETKSLHDAALARQKADWLIGMNITRLYTVLGRQAGYQEVMNVGRVLTPICQLVYSRDQEIANFQSKPYYQVDVSVETNKGSFKANWVPPEDKADEHGRCIDKHFATTTASQIQRQSAVIKSAETKKGQESPPLPFDLTSLQQYANQKWGYTADQLLKIAQSLYETHKATTYPRTDCRYLPDSQKQDTVTILSNLSRHTDLKIASEGADGSKEAKVFNDKKVTAHHAIIPTTANVDTFSFSEKEKNIFNIICRYYIAQFYPQHEFYRSVIEAECKGHLFKATGKVPVQDGWKSILSANDDTDKKKDNKQQRLPNVSAGEHAKINTAELLDKQTKAPPHFTEATLLSAMENIARFIDEPNFKKILKETSGIGTPATRAATISGAVDRGLLVRKQKKLLSTPKAQVVLSFLPDVIKSPGMTAIWEQQLEKIVDGGVSEKIFVKQISDWISKIVEQVKSQSEQIIQSNRALTAVQSNAPKCFECRNALKRLKNKKDGGFFWGCQNQECRKTFPDQNGKPVQRMSVEDHPECPECGDKMWPRKGKAPGKKRATKFWGCASFPECKGRLPFKKQREKEAV